MCLLTVFERIHKDERTAASAKPSCVPPSMLIGTIVFFDYFPTPLESLIYEPDDINGYNIGIGRVN